jgi:hypothetical protein
VIRKIQGFSKNPAKSNAGEDPFPGHLQTSTSAKVDVTISSVPAFAASMTARQIWPRFSVICPVAGSRITSSCISAIQAQESQ